MYIKGEGCAIENLLSIWIRMYDPQNRVTFKFQSNHGCIKKDPQTSQNFIPAKVKSTTSVIWAHTNQQLLHFRLLAYHCWLLEFTLQRWDLGLDSGNSPR